jgi:ribokinase
MGDRVVVVGSFNVDHVWTCGTLPRAGETLAGRYASGPGGKGFNQAVAAVRAGAATSFLCALGDDVGGQLARALSVADGIDLHDAPSREATGTAGIFVDADGRNSIVIGAGANATLDAGFVDARAATLAAARVLLVQMESPVAAIAAALRIARASAATTILNPAPANGDTTADLLALADVLTPNETEFAALLARHANKCIDPASVATMDDASLHALCRLLLPDGTVVITLGAAGAFVSHAESRRHGDARHSYRVAGEPAEVVDTTGAGDAFNGALAAALALRPAQPFAAHVAYANRYAALSTETAGAALAMPHRTQLAARFGG